MAVKKPPKKEKTIKISIPFTEALYLKVREKAEIENRSLTSQAVWELKKAFNLTNEKTEL